MRRTLLVIAFATVVAAAALLTTPNKSRAKETKFYEVEGAIPNEYIVVLKDEIAPEVVMSTTESLSKSYGGQVRYVFRYALKGFSVTMSEEAALSLSEDSQVAFVEENGTVSLATTQLNPPWGLDRIDQRFLPLTGTYEYDNTGTGVSVYIIDTGIRPTHTEFAPQGRAIAAANFEPIFEEPTPTPTPPGNCSLVPPIECPILTSFDPSTIDVTTLNNDCHGHGTHVAGTVGGITYGVAKNVRLFGVKVLDCSGSGTFESVIAGVNWVTGHHQANPGAAVANMSLAGAANVSLDFAVRNSINTGITYAVAAANSAQNANLYSPARVSEALTVGATDINDVRASFSNFGSLVDVHAPGVDVLSAWNTSDTATLTLSGTSMASPHVAGTAALYLQSFRWASPPVVHAEIVNNSTPFVLGNIPGGTPNRLLYSRFFPPEVAPHATSTDFDNDRKSDIAVWRPSNGVWWITSSLNGGLLGGPWGLANDKIVPGDYDGDGKADLAVWRPSDRVWYIINSSDGSNRYETFGLSDDIPVPADYDADGKTDVAVWRPSDGIWHILQSTNGFVRSEAWGLGSLGDRPVTADYDGDHAADLAVWRAPTGDWHIKYSSNGSMSVLNWGSQALNDVLVPADYDGDGRADLAVWRPSTGIWYIYTIITAVQRYEHWGLSGDIPVSADYDGDGRNDLAVWRPSDGVWYIINSSTGTQRYETFGLAGDIPIPAAYNR